MALCAVSRAVDNEANLPLVFLLIQQAGISTTLRFHALLGGCKLLDSFRLAAGIGSAAAVWLCLSAGWSTAAMLHSGGRYPAHTGPARELLPRRRLPALHSLRFSRGAEQQLRLSAPPLKGEIGIEIFRIESFHRSGMLAADRQVAHRLAPYGAVLGWGPSVVAGRSRSRLRFVQSVVGSGAGRQSDGQTHCRCRSGSREGEKETTPAGPPGPESARLARSA